MCINNKFQSPFSVVAEGELVLFMVILMAFNNRAANRIEA